MILAHDGIRIPRFPERWDPQDEDTVWIAWDDVANGATITASVWTVPATWTVEAQFDGVPVTTDDGTAYTAANGARLSTTDESGTYTISNRATFSDGRIIERSVNITVQQL